MLKTLRKALKALQARLTKNEDLLGKSRSRYKKFHDLTVREHRRQLKSEKAGHPARAARFKRRAEDRHTKAVYWRGRIKVELDKIHHLESSVQDREAAIKKWQKEHGVYFESPNKVRGGTPEQRLRVAIHTAALNYRKGTQPGYYSQSGATRVYRHGLEGYPYGHIWDCSTFADAVYFCCGLDSPSGPGAYHTGGYTGTELAHGHQVSRSEVRTGDLCIYLRYPGDTVGHHVEVVDDPGRETTIGHGDEAINAGTFNLFGDGLYEFRRYR